VLINFFQNGLISATNSKLPEKLSTSTLIDLNSGLDINSDKALSPINFYPFFCNSFNKPFAMLPGN
jgi:hypothetical protein